MSALSFRSILPHEPPPEENHGYLQIQGLLEPKQDDEWTKAGLTLALGDAVQSISNGQYSVQQVHLLEDVPPFTKMRITVQSPQIALSLLQHFRQLHLSPAILFANKELSARHLQLTPITTKPMLSTDICWTRSSPPKFRRLVVPTSTIRMESLEQQRQNTRFLFMTGLLIDEQITPEEWTCTTAMQCIRAILHPFESSNHGVEIFCPPKQVVRHVYIGMRSARDAQTVVATLQGKVVQWEGTKLVSGKLFFDYCDMTDKSQARSRRTLGETIERGQPSRPDCTSSTDHIVIPGLHLLEDFVSVEEQQVLMAVILGPQACWAKPQATQSHNGAVVRRRVQHYGYIFDYETADILRDVDLTPCPPLPAIENGSVLDEYIGNCTNNKEGWGVLAGVLERTRQKDIDGTTYSTINQLTINEYKPGDGIGSHIDTISAFGDGLFSLSLHSGIVMEFKKGDEKKLVFLPPRSLLAMTGPARCEWEHMIVTRRTDTYNGEVIPRDLRVSLTLRTALDLNGCPMPRRETSLFPLVVQAHNSISSLATPDTEREFVHKVYDAIATQWHHTRGKRGVLWPGATLFLQELPMGSIVADVGCGDGKYFPAIWENGSYVIGFDISRPLLKTSFGASANDPPESRRISEFRNHLRDRPAVGVADCMNVPLKSKSCDAAICIAVMHHLSTEERRILCLKELVRIVKAGGMINVQAWAMDQDDGSRHRFDAADVFVPFNAQPKYLDKSNSDEVSNKSVAEQYADAYDGAEFDEKKGLVIFQRYCHLYRSGELETLVKRLDGVEIADCGFESGNYFVILRVTE